VERASKKQAACMRVAAVSQRCVLRYIRGKIMAGEEARGCMGGILLS
jgi:hypothetical protein